MTTLYVADTNRHIKIRTTAIGWTLKKRRYGLNHDQKSDIHKYKDIYHYTYDAILHRRVLQETFRHQVIYIYIYAFKKNLDIV